jgi:hypothetical protein
MVTAYSPILKLALPVQGELSGTWGDVVNDNITSMVEQAIAGRAVIDTWTTNSHVLTTANGTTSESRCAMLEFTDTGTALSGAGTVICPTLSKIYIAKNASGQNVTLKTSGGTGILVPNGRTMFLFCDGTNVVEAVTSTTSLQLGTSTIVTAVLDEDDMASDSATSLATQQSIKAYVDSQVGANNELSEVLANGNTSGANDIIMTSGQKITTNTIDETTAASGVTIDSVLLKDDGVNATNLEITNIKANDGTAAGSIADSTGVVTVLSSILTTADINGGTADGVIIGGTTPAAATVTNLIANTDLIIAGTTTITAVLDEDNMASDSAAALATQQSIKAYVDSQVGTVDTLAEILAIGNTTGGTDLAVSTGDDITFADSSKAIFGDGSDLQIYHSGSNSHITEGGTGNLIIRADDFRVQSNAGEEYIAADANGAVSLRYDNALKLATTATGIDVTGVITTDGMTTSADINFGDNDKAIFGAGDDLQIYHDGTQNYIEDAGTGNLNFKSNGNNFNFLDGSDNVVMQIDIDSATTLYHNTSAKLATTSTGIDVTGTVTATGTSVFASLDISGDIDVDGTTNLDVVDIDGATQIDATVTVGVDDTGYDVKFFGATAGAYMLWDESADDLILGGAAGLSVNSTALVTGVLTTTAATVSNGGGQFNGAINVGVDDTGYDVKFFGATAGKYMLWDESADTLEVSGTVTADGLTVSPTSGDTPASIVTTTSGSFLEFTDGNTTVGRSPLVGAITDDLSFYTSAGSYSEKLRIDSLGGITGTSQAGGHVVFNEGGIDADFRVESDTNANALFVQGSDGNVGIGTSSPTYKLNVLSDAGAQNIFQAGQSGVSNGLSITSDGSALTYSFLTGNVGIGASPIANLSVLGGTSNASNLATAYSLAAFNITPKSTSGYSLQFGSGPSDIPYIQMSAGGAASGNLLIQPYGGNVGIGTSSPTQQLDVTATGASTAIIVAQNTTATSGGASLRAGNPQNTLIMGTDSDGGGLTGTANASYFYTTSASPILFMPNTVERMRIDSSGGLITTPAAGGHAVFNEGGIDADFRVESDTNANMLTVDAGNNTLGIGKFGDGGGATSKGAYFNDSAGNFFHQVNTHTSTAPTHCLLYLNRQSSDGDLVEFRQADSAEGTISVSGSTVSYNGFSGRHESSGIPANTPVGTVVSTINELDVYPDNTTNIEGNIVPHKKAGQTRADHAKVEVSTSAGDPCVYGVVSEFNGDGKLIVTSVGVGSIRVTGACSKGDLLESNGDGTAKVQSDDIIRSKTIGKVTIGNSDTGVKLVACVMYCG